MEEKERKLNKLLEPTFKDCACCKRNHLIPDKRVKCLGCYASCKDNLLGECKSLAKQEKLNEK